MSAQTSAADRGAFDERHSAKGSRVAVSEEEEILEFLRSEQDAYYHGDLEGFLDHWHHGPEVIRLVTGPLVGTRIHRGWDELLPRFLEGFRRYPQDFDNRKIIHNKNVRVQIVGDMAWISYDQVAVDRPDGMHLPTLSHGLKIVQRYNGAWKLVCLFDVSPGSGRDDVPRIELTANGRIASMNDVAKARLPHDAGLIVTGGRLRARQRNYAAGLKAAIDMRRSDLSTNLPSGYLTEMASVVPLGEDDHGHPLFCWVMVDHDRILVTFDDALMLRRKLEKASQTFALSPAQTALAELLASGQDLACAASNLGISVNTVRTQVRRMFEKTGTHTQAALVSLLLSVQNPEYLAF
jgi:DNA-binding CsgD family transcriptional regulator